jgi:hypothetical protein
MNLINISIAVLALSVIGLTVFTDQGIYLVSSNDFSKSSEDLIEKSEILNSINHHPITPSIPIIKKPAKKSISDFQSTAERPIEKIRNQIDKTDLQKRIVSEYDNFRRYPPENSAIESSAQDPITQRYAADERTTLNEDKSMGLTVWSEEKYYLENDTVTVNAYIENAEGIKQATVFNSTFYYDQNQSLGNLEFSDKDDDGVYQTTIELTQNITLNKGTGIYKVWIQDVNNKISDSITFTLSQPDIQLTGNYSESINSNGDLIIDAEVEIKANSNYYVQASLYSSTQVAIGVTQFSQQLTIGTHWIPLSFSGLMIQDSNENGPYVLRQASVAKVTMPMQRAPLIEPNFITESYALSEFMP